MAEGEQLIVLASQNRGKIAELRTLLHGLPFEVRSSKEMGFTTSIAETGLTFAENARIKAEAVSRTLQCWSIADDSGLVVDALGGAPGVHSARYAGEFASDVENNNKLMGALRELEEVSSGKRSARFVSVVALARPGLETLFFEGLCEGEILDAPRGSSGFGYDPLFVPRGETRSFAELSEQAKNELSHRGMAMRLLKSFLLRLLA